MSDGLGVILIFIGMVIFTILFYAAIVLVAGYIVLWLLQHFGILAHFGIGTLTGLM